MPQDIHSNWFRRHFTAITRGVLCLLWTILFLVALFIGGGRLALMEGQSNGAVNSFGLWMLCVLSGMVVGVLYLAGIVIRFVRGGDGEGTIWCAATVTLPIVLFVFPGPQRRSAYLTGIKQWAAPIDPAHIRTWSASLGLNNAPPAEKPYWWHLKDHDKPFGVPAPIGTTRLLFSGPLPDEARIFPATGRTIFWWGHTGSYSRLLVVNGEGETAPPTEFDSNRVTWHPLANGMWFGVQETH